MSLARRTEATLEEVVGAEGNERLLFFAAMPLQNLEYSSLEVAIPNAMRLPSKNSKPRRCPSRKASWR